MESSTKEQLSYETEKGIAMEMKDVSFSYDGKHTIIQNLSLAIPIGKITVLMGSNGCGKTTLFHLMTKNLKPDKGSILLYEKNISNVLLRNFSSQVAIVHQNNVAPNDITVEKLVSYGRTPYISMFGGEKETDSSAVQWALKVTNLEKYRKKQVADLSGGQKQRVWIAMALAQKTQILFLDEPTTFLDIRYQIEILQLIRYINQAFGMTIVMVLHDINQAMEYSDLFVGMKSGQILVEGAPDEVVNTDVLEELYGIRLKIKSVGSHRIVLTI